MKHLLFTFVALAVLLAACQSAPAEVPPTEPPTAVQSPPQVVAEEPATHGNVSARNNLDWAGVYRGVVSTSRGVYTRVQISLRDDQALGGVFSLSFEHLPDNAPLPEIDDFTWEGWAERVGFESGKFDWDETGNVIRLDVNDWPPYFFVSEARIIQIDTPGNPFMGEVAEKYVLYKVMPGPTPLAPQSEPVREEEFVAATLADTSWESIYYHTAVVMSPISIDVFGNGEVMATVNRKVRLHEQAWNTFNNPEGIDGIVAAIRNGQRMTDMLLPSGMYLAEHGADITLSCRTTAPPRLTVGRQLSQMPEIVAASFFLTTPYLAG